MQQLGPPRQLHAMYLLYHTYELIVNRVLDGFLHGPPEVAGLTVPVVAVHVTCMSRFHIQ
jgi:hypothetical protein